MIDELKLVHCCLSVRLRRSVAGAHSEVQRLNVTVSGASPPAPIPVRPPRRRSSSPPANRQQSSTHSSPFHSRNASVRRGQWEKKSLKLAYTQKNRPEFLRIRGDLMKLPSFAALGHPSPPGAIGRQCAISPWPSSSGGPEGGGAATSSSQAIGIGR